jgi:hypothetical protein
MMQLRQVRAVLTGTLGGLIMIVIAACPPQNDGGNSCTEECAEDEICGADGKCSKLPESVLDSGPPVDAGPAVDSGSLPDAGPQGDSGPGADGGMVADGGPALDFAEVLLTQPPRWLTWSDDGTEILFPQEEKSGATYIRERIERLDPSSAVVAASPAWDFFNTLPTQPCLLEDWRVEPDIGSSAEGELWLGCRETIPQGNGTLRIIHPDSLQAEGAAPGVEAHTGIAATQDTEAHRVWFKLGGNQIFSFEVADGSQIRLDDTVDSALSFSQIRKIFAMERPSGSTYTHLMVHDSGTGTLIPMRFFATGWEKALSPLTEKSIPTGAHVIHFLAGHGTFDELDFLAVYPQSGEVRYFQHYYNQSTTDEEPVTVFETLNQYQAAPPTADVDLFRNPVPTPSGDHIFYMHPDIPRIWRLPLTPGSATLVLSYTLPDTNDRPRGIVALSEDTVWLAVESPTNNRLMRVKLQ